MSVDLHDADNKTMIFHAVAGSQLSVLRCLLSLVSCSLQDNV